MIALVTSSAMKRSSVAAAISPPPAAGARGRTGAGGEGAGCGPGHGSGARAARAPVDGLEGRREVLGFAVLDEVDEDALAAVDVHVELGHELEDEIHLRLAGVDHQRVGPALRHDER